MEAARMKGKTDEQSSATSAQTVSELRSLLSCRPPPSIIALITGEYVLDEPLFVPRDCRIIGVVHDPTHR